VAHKVLSQGLQHLGDSTAQVQGEAHAHGVASAGKGSESSTCLHSHDAAADDLRDALAALTSLATALVSGGPWWQEAKVNHPVLLIETVDALLWVSKRFM
jgi:hypothetical protein